MTGVRLGGGSRNMDRGPQGMERRLRATGLANDRMVWKGSRHANGRIGVFQRGYGAQ